MSDDQIIITTQEKLEVAFTPPQIETTEVLIREDRRQRQEGFQIAIREGIQPVRRVEQPIRRERSW